MDVIYIHKASFFFPTIYNFFFFLISSHGAFLDKTIMIQMSWEQSPMRHFSWTCTDKGNYFLTERNHFKVPRPDPAPAQVSFLCQLRQELSRRAMLLVPGLNLSNTGHRAMGTHKPAQPPLFSFPPPSPTICPSSCMVFVASPVSVKFSVMCL